MGEFLREARMNGLSGPSRQLSDYRGRPLMITVWASWCAPCRAEMASLERLYQRPGARQFAIIGISTDDYPDAAKGWLRKARTSFAHYIDQQLLLENMLGADKIPLTILIDANGKVLSKHYGSRTWDDAESVATITRSFKIRL